MSSCYQSRLVSSVSFDRVYNVNVNSFVCWSRSVSYSFVRKGAVVVDLGKFDLFRVSPSGIPVSPIEFHGLCMVSWYLKAVHELRFVPEGMKLGLVGQSKNTLRSLGIFLQQSRIPSWLTDQIIMCRILVDADRDWILIEDTCLLVRGERFPCSLPSFPKD